MRIVDDPSVNVKHLRAIIADARRESKAASRARNKSLAGGKSVSTSTRHNRFQVSAKRGLSDFCVRIWPVYEIRSSNHAVCRFGIVLLCDGYAGVRVSIVLCC